MIENSRLTASTGVVREVRIKARPETIFPFLVDADKMIRWMGSEAILDARPGGEFSILVGGQHRALGQYVEIDPPHRVVLTWGWEGDAMQIPPGSSRIEIDLIPDGAETVLRLLHTDLPEAAYADHQHGWDHYLARLATLAGGGDPGADPWDSTTGPADDATAAGRVA